MQYLILDTDRTLSTEAIDLGVNETWKFLNDHFELDQLKLIISVIDDTEPFCMNQRLLKSLIFDLVNSTAAEGKHSRIYRPIANML